MRPRCSGATSPTMARLILCVMLICALCGAYGQSSPEPVCDPAQYAGDPSKPIPRLPSQFSTVVEANILGSSSGTTFEIGVREYFDQVGNRGRLEYSSLGIFAYGIFDYNLQEVFLLSDVLTGGDCVVRRIAQGEQLLERTFGFTVQNGSVHIGRVSDFFQLTDAVAINYIGQEYVRGIPCDYWQSCHVLNTSSYTVDYFFSRNDSGWMSAYGDDPVPVQIIVNGSAPNFNGPGPNMNGSSDFRNVINIYTFITFNSGPDSVPDEVFAQPIGVACKGRIPGQVLPLLPNYFSTYIESVDETQQTTSIVREFYDLDFQLFRIDYYVEAQSGLPAGAYSFIHDFNLKTQYIINRQYGNCSIKPIEPQAGFDTVVEDGIARLASPSELLLLSNEFNYSYEGVSTVRGVDVDSWISYSEFQELGQVNLSNVLYEIFFTRPDWSIGSVSSRPSSDTTTPWQFHFTGTITYQNSTNLTETRNVSATYDFFGFSDGEPDLDVFDTSVCVAPSDYYIVVLSLPVENVLVDFSRLRRTVRDRVSNVTGVRPLQIGNIQVIGSNSSSLLLSLHISNLPNVSLKLEQNPVSARQATEKLITMATESKDGTLDIDIELAPDQMSSPTLHVVRSESGTVYHAFDSEEEEESRLSDGVVVAIALVMLAVGVALGVLGTVGVFFLVRCMRSLGSVDLGKIGAVSYEKQKDDVVVSD